MISEGFTIFEFKNYKVRNTKKKATNDTRYFL